MQKNQSTINKIISLFFILGYATMLLGAVLGVFSLSIAFYVFAVGCLLNTVGRLRLLPQSDDRRIRRLNTQQFFVVAGFIATAYFLYKGAMSWAIFLLMSVVIDFYLTYRYPKQKE